MSPTPLLGYVITCLSLTSSSHAACHAFLGPSTLRFTPRSSLLHRRPAPLPRLPSPPLVAPLPTASITPSLPRPSVCCARGVSNAVEGRARPAAATLRRMAEKGSSRKGGQCTQGWPDQRTGNTRARLRLRTSTGRTKAVAARAAKADESRGTRPAMQPWERPSKGRQNAASPACPAPHARSSNPPWKTKRLWCTTRPFAPLGPSLLGCPRAGRRAGEPPARSHLRPSSPSRARGSWRSPSPSGTLCAATRALGRC